MTQSPVSADKKTTDTPDKPRGKVAKPALLMTTTALDTTWRVILPGTAGVVGGLVLDRTWNTTPLFMIIGLVLGIALSAYLIYRQFKAVNL